MKRLLLMSLFFVCNVWGMQDPVSSTNYYDGFNKKLWEELIKCKKVEDTEFKEIRFLLILNRDEEKNKQLILDQIKNYNPKQLNALYKQLETWDNNINKPKFDDSYMYIYKNRYKFAQGVVKEMINTSSGSERTLFENEMVNVDTNKDISNSEESSVSLNEKNYKRVTSEKIKKILQCRRKRRNPKIVSDSNGMQKNCINSRIAISLLNIKGQIVMR